MHINKSRSLEQYLQRKLELNLARKQIEFEKVRFVKGKLNLTPRARILEKEIHRLKSVINQRKKLLKVAS